MKILWLPIICGLMSCSRSTSNLEVFVSRFEFNGLRLTLPSSGDYKIGSAKLTFQKGAQTITVLQLPDKTFEIRQNGVVLGTAKAGEHVSISDQGQLQRIPEKGG